ncbi:MAG TPA: hypothetical protein VKQ54_12235 [Caulobacteraceae bacterium]|nr:hypothetical protein [Caulobacteraceae bacterium]
MKATLLIGGAAALFAGAATAELGLAPIHQAVAETAPSLDTTAADVPQPIRADLQSGVVTYPPAVIVPVSAPAPKAPRPDTRDDRASMAEADARPADGDDTREVVDRDPSLESPEARPAARDAEPEGDPPAEDSAPVAPD